MHLDTAKLPYIMAMHDQELSSAHFPSPSISISMGHSDRIPSSATSSSAAFAHPTRKTRNTFVRDLVTTRLKLKPALASSQSSAVASWECQQLPYVTQAEFVRVILHAHQEQLNQQRGHGGPDRFNAAAAVVDGFDASTSGKGFSSSSSSAAAAAEHHNSRDLVQGSSARPLLMPPDVCKLFDFQRPAART